MKILVDSAVGPMTWQAALGAAERQQQAHYDNIAADYEAHYSDEWSIQYRRKFIYEPMFEGLDLEGMKVLDAMCGSGQTTDYLLSRGATVTGLDISNQVIDTFQSRWTSATAVKRSLVDSGLADNTFDCVVVIGGLHHIHLNVKRAVREIHRVLKPGGYFCFMEPHSGSLPDLVRRVWYRFDRFFSDNEAAIDIAALQRDFSDCFELRKAKYLGNFAFLLVLNSLIFRIPPRSKKFFAPVLMRLEPLVNKLQTKLTSCFVVTQWKKSYPR
ncbi:MAG TPA: class I SAM-dependent methyltransferase [Pyrinomonadaceae bacterium]|nr:class I SAM-dependent methyltransferase [Pyrinomonadaceae bacterium]